MVAAAQPEEGDGVSDPKTDSAKCAACGREDCRHFVCSGCSEHCHFPTQVYEHRKPGLPDSEVVATCGCGMTHKLTMAKGAVSEVPEGVALDTGWRKKKDEADRVKRDAEVTAMLAKHTELRAAGKCVHCEQALPKEGA